MCKTKRKKDDALIGIDSICAFGERSAVTLLNWRKWYQFPMEKNKEGLVWISSKKKIIGWYEERGLNPKTVSEAKLERYRMQQVRKAGKAPKFNKVLYDIDNIGRFFNISPGQVIMFERSYPDCPIQKEEETGRWYVDADAFEAFLESLGLKIGPLKTAPPVEKKFARDYEPF